MKRCFNKLFLLLVLIFFVLNAAAATRYVDLTSPSPAPPYTNWLTAATNVQDAIDAAVDGDQVLVTNGVYSTGGRVVYGAMTNRVVLTNAVTLLSLNGPQATKIVGGTQMRCVYVGSNSVLSGFTITNGHARTSGDLTNECSGGGIWSESGGVVANCLVISNVASIGGGIYGGTISNCTLVGNTAGAGGGVAGAAAVWNCTLSNNVANSGGGAYGVALHNSILTKNAAVYSSGSNGRGAGASQCQAYDCTLVKNTTDSGSGGGTYQGTNFNCSMTGNAAGSGGGSFQSTNFNCVISENFALYNGGGAYQGALYNCILSGNAATNALSFNGNGGGLYSATPVNCTVTGNSASGTGGGMYGGTAFNSIIYFNSAAGGPNWTNYPSMYYCCTTPTIPFLGGVGNISSNPSFLDMPGGVFRLKCGSPCIDAGFTNGLIVAASNDIRGVIRPLDGNSDSLAQFDMGAYEYDPATDPVPNIHKDFSFDNFATFYPVSFVAQIGGCADYFWWDFGDGTTVSNQYTISHAWSSPGTFNVKLSAYYSSLAQSLSVTTQVQVVQPPVYYVDLNSPSPAAPYTNWTSAAHIIQQAVAAGTTPGRLVLVTNGVYRDSGVIIYGSIYNSVALTNPVVVRSANGPDTTIIWPSQPARRCAYVGDNAILSGFTLTGGHTLSSGDLYKEQSGAGVWCEIGGVASNCVIAGNSAYKNGGGAYQGTFYDCVLSNNSFGFNGAAQGGGIYGGTLYNCTVVSNAAVTVGAGSGAYKSTLYDCLIAGNLSHDIGGGSCSNTLWNCTLVANTAGKGGGSYCDTLYNCLVSGNAANNSGGGTYGSTLYNCLVAGNSALAAGGGAYSGTIYNATIVSNTAPTGGGVYAGSQSYAYNSIIFYNTASSSGNNWQGSLLILNTCSVPAVGPAAWGNITNEPAFLNLAAGDLRLHFGSPCVDAGTNLSPFITNDLVGNARPLDGDGDGTAKFDMGAYEFDLWATVGTNWLLNYGLNPNDPLVFATDPDGDAFTTLQEWIAGTDPTNTLSALKMLLPTNDATGIRITWESVSTRNYWLERATNFGDVPPFQTIATNIAGSVGTKTYTDTTATNAGTYFYRVGVQ